MIIVARAVLGHGHEVNNRVAGRRSIDNGGGSDSYVRRHLTASAIVGGDFAGLESGFVPDEGAAVGVVGVDAVMFGCDDQQVVGDTGDTDGRNVERLCVDQSVGGDRKKFSEGGGIHILWCEHGLAVVKPSTRVNVVVSEDVLGVRKVSQGTQNHNYQNGEGGIREGNGWLSKRHDISKFYT